MTLIHMVLIKFKPEVSQEHKDAFVSELKAVDKTFPHVKRAFVGCSLSDEFNNGFEIGFVSFHEDLAALTRYRASDEHDRATSKFIYPFYEQLCAFDFEIDPLDEEKGVPGLLPFFSRKVCTIETALSEKCGTVDFKRGKL